MKFVRWLQDSGQRLALRITRVAETKEVFCTQPEKKTEAGEKAGLGLMNLTTPHAVLIN